MNPLFGDLTKNSGNQDNLSAKSASKHPLSATSNVSIAEIVNSLENKIKGNNFLNLPQLGQELNGLQLENAKRHNSEEEKIKVNLNLGSISNERMIEINPQMNEPKQKTPQRLLDGFLDLATSSVGQNGTKPSKKRKNDKLSVTQEKTAENTPITTTTKKVKTSTLKDFFEDAAMNKLGHMPSDSSIGSVENLPLMHGKENYFSATGPKKITDFFKTRELLEESNYHSIAAQPNISRFLTRTKNGQFPIEEEPNQTNQWEEERARYIERIRELEGKVESLKRDREKDQVKMEEYIAHKEEEVEEYKKRVRKILASMTLEIENYKRIEKKNFLNQQKQRLGEYVTQRGGSKFVDVWSDGQEIKSVKEQLVF